jgi:hypothetical protein
MEAFTFKFDDNTLGINPRTSHFGQNNNQDHHSVREKMNIPELKKSLCIVFLEFSTTSGWQEKFAKININRDLSQIKNEKKFAT